MTAPNKDPNPVKIDSLGRRYSKMPGAPTKYDPSYCDELIDYFCIPPEDPKTHKANDLPTVSGFCCVIGITRDTYYDWVKRYPAFSDSHKKAQESQFHIWQTNSLKGRYNTPFTIFMGKNVFGWTDKTETNINISIEDKIRSLGAPDAPIQIEGQAQDAD